MKFLNILVLFLSISYNIQAQISLEHTYTPIAATGNVIRADLRSVAEYYQGSGGGDYISYLFKIVHIDNVGEKYIWVNPVTLAVKLYNLDHSIYKSLVMDFSSQGLSPTNGRFKSIYVDYVSEQLFDTDTGLEFIVRVTYDPSSGSEKHFTAIMEETGVPTLYILDGHISFRDDGDESPNGIVNTSAGTKMFVQYDDSTQVYSLAGTLPTAPTGFARSMQEKSIELQNSPNPAQLFTRIYYKLPAQVEDATLTIVNSQGIQILEYAVDTNFDHILVSTQDLPSGTYMYTITTDTGIVHSKKMIVVQ